MFLFLFYFILFAIFGSINHLVKSFISHGIGSIFIIARVFLDRTKMSMVKFGLLIYSSSHSLCRPHGLFWASPLFFYIVFKQKPLCFLHTISYLHTFHMNRIEDVRYVYHLTCIKKKSSDLATELQLQIIIIR